MISKTTSTLAKKTVLLLAFPLITLGLVLLLRPGFLSSVVLMVVWLDLAVTSLSLYKTRVQGAWPVWPATAKSETYAELSLSILIAVVWLSSGFWLTAALALACIALRLNQPGRLN